MKQKSVYDVSAKTVLNLKSGFKSKGLCDGLTFTAGSACTYSCSYCYVPAMMAKSPHIAALKKDNVSFQNAIIRRKDAINTLRTQLHDARGVPRFKDPGDTRVIFTSPLVDCAANMALAKETIAMCEIILEATNWQIRLLSKSTLLPVIARSLSTYRDRLIFGVSTGTLDDGIAKAIELLTPPASKRIESLHTLQDEGFRTFGMICPSLPQEDYDQFAQKICEAIRIEKCEHVWAEVLNTRGASHRQTLNALRHAGYVAEADLLEKTADTALWEVYARSTFTAHAERIPPHKLKFLQYTSVKTHDWWQQRESLGAILL